MLATIKDTVQWTAAALEETLKMAATKAKYSGEAVYLKDTGRRINYKNTGVMVPVYRFQSKVDGAQYKVKPDGDVRMNLEHCDNLD